MRSNRTELVVMEPARTEIARSEAQMSFAEMREFATEVSKSGMFAADRQPLSVAQIMTLMLISKSRGLPMIEGVMRYDVIEGKPAMKARCLLAEFLAAGGVVEWLECTDEVCRAVFSHSRVHPKPFPVHLTLEEFVRKGVTAGREGMKRNWKLWSRQMLMARASSLAVNAIMPGVSMGVPISEEIDTIDVTPAKESPVAQRPTPSEADQAGGESRDYRQNGR